MNTVDYQPKGFSDIFSTELGQNIWAYLNTEEIWVLLKLTTELGHPAVEGIGDKLIMKYGYYIKEDRIKQAIGHMVRPIMEAHGFGIAQKGVRCRKKKELFTFAAKYKKMDTIPSKFGEPDPKYAGIEYQVAVMEKKKAEKTQQHGG